MQTDKAINEAMNNAIQTILNNPTDYDPDWELSDKAVMDTFNKHKILPYLENELIVLYKNNFDIWQKDKWIHHDYLWEQTDIYFDKLYKNFDFIFRDNNMIDSPIGKIYHPTFIGQFATHIIIRSIFIQFLYNLFKKPNK